MGTAADTAGAAGPSRDYGQDGAADGPGLSCSTLQHAEDTTTLIEIEPGDAMRLMRLSSARLHYECGDSSLLILSTVVSLPCEASTEAQTSDLELTRASVD